MNSNDKSETNSLRADGVVDTPSSNRGCATYKTRPLPTVCLSACPPTYARLAAQGWDSWQEAFALKPSVEFTDILDRAQKRARENSNDDGKTLIELAGERFAVSSHGAKGGFRWRFENDDFIIFVGSPKREWTISVRYTSSGLWEHGHNALRLRAFNVLNPYAVPTDPDRIRVSRADYCFDFYSPLFMREFKPRIVEHMVCPSGCKARIDGSFSAWGRAGRGETLTAGTKRGLQVQIYDKTREIDEVSGKTWLYGVWAGGLGEWPWKNKPRDMVRLEVRFSGNFLKDRNVRRPHELEASRTKLVAEALYMRRLTIPDATDRNRWRASLHPIWSEAVRNAGAQSMLPIGRKVTGARDALAVSAEKQIAGTFRSAIVLTDGDYDEVKARELFDRALERLRNDPKHHDKVISAMDRYSQVDEAK